jgi:hypothetical protein
MSKKQMNNLAAVLPMYEAFKKLEGILDEALDLLREGRAATDWNRWAWNARAQDFIEKHEKRTSTSASIAVGKQP